jgi:hypothetical protein
VYGISNLFAQEGQMFAHVQPKRETYFLALFELQENR